MKIDISPSVRRMVYALCGGFLCMSAAVKLFELLGGFSAYCPDCNGKVYVPLAWLGATCLGIGLLMPACFKSGKNLRAIAQVVAGVGCVIAAGYVWGIVTMQR